MRWARRSASSSGVEVIKITEELSPDVIIMDIAMPEMDGIQATSIIRDRFPRVKIIILSMHNSSSLVKKALKYGAMGFVLKDSAFEELAAAINTVKNNSYYLSVPLMGAVVENYIELHTGTEAERLYNALSAREKEVFYFMVRGYNRKKIADQLNISLHTVV